MRRREFVILLGSVAAAWPLAARAQHERTRHVGMITAGSDENDPDAQANRLAFVHAMHQLGWVEGRNLRIDYFWGRGQPEAVRQHAANLAALAPDVIVSSGTTALGSLFRATRTVPIVFVNVADPVGSGFVDTLSRPGRNATGFHAVRVQFERKMAGGPKADCARRDASRSPAGRRCALRDRPIRRHPVGGAIGRRGSQTPKYARRRRDGGRHRGFARSPTGGLLVTSSALALHHREQIIALAAHHKMPAVYYRRYFITSGGLISYGPDLADQYRRAAGYVDRILKGEKPADLAGAGSDQI